jgi:hypothetical protein
MKLGGMSCASSHAFGVTLLEGGACSSRELCSRSSSEAVRVCWRDAPRRRSLLLKAEGRS